MAIAEELKVSVRADVEGALRNLNKVEKQTGGTEKGFKKFTKFLSTSGVGSFLAIGTAVAGVTKFLSDSEKAARDAQEVLSKYDFVFESMGSAAEDAATNFADSFGLADSTAKKLLGTTGDLLVGMGATEGQALDLATEVNTLAADLASFSNIEGGTERASQALTAALLGEREQAKMLGVVIREADVQQKLMEKGQQDLTGQALLLAKAQATLELATEQSGKAMGDYERTADSAANVTRRAEEATKALKEAVGNSVVEAVTPFKRAWANVADQLAEVINKQNEVNAANKAAEEGTATIEDRVLLLTEEIAAMERAIKTASEYGDTTFAENKLALKKQELRYTLAHADMIEEQAAAERKANEEAAQAAQEEADRNAERQADLAALNEEWANTKEGQIAATEEAIKYFESFIQTEKVKAVLENLYDQLEKLKDIEVAVTTESEVMVASMLAGYETLQPKVQEVAEETASLFEQTFSSIRSTTGEVLGSLTNMWSNYYEKQLEGMDKNSSEYKSIMREQARMEKSMALFKVAVDTALAITGFLVKPGGPVGWVMSGLAAAAGAAQAAAIASAPMPALAEGGIVTKPTTALIGEAGPEAVIPLGKGGMGTTVNVYNMGTAIMQEQFETSVVAAVARGNRGY